MHVFLKFLVYFSMKMESVCEKSIQPPHYSVQTFSFADRYSTTEIFDVEKNGGGLIEIMDHIVNGRAVCCCLVTGA